MVITIGISWDVMIFFLFKSGFLMFVGFKAKTKAGFYRFPLSGTTSQLDISTLMYGFCASNHWLGCTSKCGSISISQAHRPGSLEDIEDSQVMFGCQVCLPASPPLPLQQDFALYLIGGFNMFFGFHELNMMTSWVETTFFPTNIWDFRMVFMGVSSLQHSWIAE